MSDFIRFLLNGDLVEVHGVSPQTTLLEYLRERAGLPGTKEGCAEGDCGACTVALADAHPDGGLRYRPVNACIRLLPTVDGKAVYTVESLKAADGALHPAQQAMVDCHGSQCGFCTPGFVMSLFGMYKNARRPTRVEAMDALSGNLCRCTGYRPILDAAAAMYDLAAPADWRGPGIAADGTRNIARDEETTAMRLGTLARSATFVYGAGEARYYAPTSIGELAALIDAHRDACILAGGTDVGLWVTKQHRDLSAIIHLGNVAELAAVRESGDAIEIGAAVSLADAQAVLDTEWPELAEAWTRFGSVPIRNAATLCGNVANGSPIGDSMPALIALAATVVLRRGNCERELPLEAFCLDYRKTALAPGEFVAAIRVPRKMKVSSRETRVAAYKVSRRFDQDISAVFACFRVDVDGGRILAARIGCGGVAATPVRAHATEGALTGRRWTATTARAAGEVLRDEFTPITDMRASADYRRDVLGALLLRFWRETGDDVRMKGAPTRVQDVHA